MLHAVIRTPLLIAALIAFAISTAFARDDIRTERVHFKPGTSSATIKVKIKGNETVDYVLEASKGEQMNTSMATNNGANYFNILASGENEIAMFIGSAGTNSRARSRRVETTRSCLYDAQRGAPRSGGKLSPRDDRHWRCREG